MSLKGQGRRATVDGADSLVVPRNFSHGIEAVWEAVTDPEALKPWIGTWTGDSATGTVVFFMTHEGEEHAGETVTIHACQAPTHLSVTTVTNDDAAVEFTIIINLTEEPGVTRMEFVQSVPDPSWGSGMGPGWEYYLDRLAAQLNGEDIEAVDFEKYQAELTPYYKELFPG